MASHPILVHPPSRSPFSKGIIERPTTNSIRESFQKSLFDAGLELDRGRRARADLSRTQQSATASTDKPDERRPQPHRVDRKPASDSDKPLNRREIDDEERGSIRDASAQEEHTVHDDAPPVDSISNATPTEQDQPASSDVIAADLAARRADLAEENELLSDEFLEVPLPSPDPADGPDPHPSQPFDAASPHRPVVHVSSDAAAQNPTPPAAPTTQAVVTDPGQANHPQGHANATQPVESVEPADKTQLPSQPSADKDHQTVTTQGRLTDPPPAQPQADPQRTARSRQPLITDHEARTADPSSAKPPHPGHTDDGQTGLNHRHPPQNPSVGTHDLPGPNGDVTETSSQATAPGSPHATPPGLPSGPSPAATAVDSPTPPPVAGSPTVNPTAPATDATPTAQVSAPLNTEMETDPNVARVMRGMRGVIHQNGGSVNVRLNPPDLGVVRVQMRIDQGTVVAQLQAEHESVRTLLNHQLGQLRSALESHGLTVDKLDVQTLPTPSSENGTDQSGPDGRSRGRFDQPGHSGSRRDDQQRDDGRGRRQPVTSFEQALNMVA